MELKAIKMKYKVFKLLRLLEMLKAIANHWISKSFWLRFEGTLKNLLWNRNVHPTTSAYLSLKIPSFLWQDVKQALFLSKKQHKAAKGSSVCVSVKRVAWGDLHQLWWYIKVVPVCFLTASFFLPPHFFICVSRLTQYRQKRTAPTCREGSLVCWMMSLFGKDECVGGGGGGPVKGGGLQQQLQNAITD